MREVASKRVSIEVIKESRALVESVAGEVYYPFNLGLVLMEASAEERAVISALVKRAKLSRQAPSE
jgi:hypothetical protein